MVAVVLSAALLGVDAHAIEVEVELSPGLPYFSVIGLGGTSVQEARYRIQAALRASGVELPHKRITVNLAPASVRKDGAALDLPMALCLLIGCGALDARLLDRTLAVGELSLDGSLRSVRGTLSFAALARDLGCERIIVPRENGPEALAVPEVRVIAAATLPELLADLRGEATIPPPVVPDLRPEPVTHDFRDVRGQQVARRALEIAAAGGHNILLVGSPGSGKTMLARRVATILPEPTRREQIEVTKIWSAAGLTIGSSQLVPRRPFRAPHHTISEAGLIGGGSTIRPGEVSLAHHGVLFLDEIPEIPRHTLDSLRQPLEDREVVISRARQTARLPASFMLVAAANPCPCGWLGHRSRPCLCSDRDVRRYLGRLSGPLLDRIDLVVEAPALSPEELVSEEVGEASERIRERVNRARELANQRQGTSNAELHGRALKEYVALEPAARVMLRTALERLDLSARAVDRTTRVARTIADLAGSALVSREALAEAIQYRHPSQIGEAPCAPGEVPRGTPPGEE